MQNGQARKIELIDEVFDALLIGRGLAVAPFAPFLDFLDTGKIIAAIDGYGAESCGPQAAEGAADIPHAQSFRHSIQSAAQSVSDTWS